jgi:site-specific recombinase XerD
VWPARRLTWADRPVAARTVSRWFRVAVADAELPPDACFHGLRHAFASHLHAAGADLSALQAALGHRSLATTARYVHRSPDALRRTPSPLDLLSE